MNNQNVKTRQISICEVCNKNFIFNPLTAKGRFCSYQCYWKSKKGIIPRHLKVFKKGVHASRATEFKKGSKGHFKNATISYKCIACNKEIIDFKSHKRKFCSYDCYWKNKKGSIVLNKKGKVHQICAFCNSNFTVYPHRLKNRTRLFCSKKCFYNFKTGRNITIQHRKKISESLIKIREKNNLWRGGITKLNKKIRESFQYTIWREKNFKRDNYTCQLCGQKGGKLQVDHIIPFALILKENNIKSLQEAFLCLHLWDMNNGRTLCINCHKKTPTWGVGTFNLLYHNTLNYE